MSSNSIHAVACPQHVSAERQAENEILKILQEFYGSELRNIPKGSKLKVSWGESLVNEKVYTVVNKKE